MQVDLDAAKKTAVAAGESLHAARGDNCRTRLLELSAADMGLLDGAGRTSDEARRASVLSASFCAPRRMHRGGVP